MVKMAETETQPVTIIESSLENREDILAAVKELKAILKEAIAILS
jgi:hypothetical protein